MAGTCGREWKRKDYRWRKNRQELFKSYNVDLMRLQKGNELKKKSVSDYNMCSEVIGIKIQLYLVEISITSLIIWN